MKIGVFDSGVGGKSVANAIQRTLPGYEIMLKEDKANLPYGTKTPEQLFSLVAPILEEMVQAGCKVVVIACNSVTTTIISQLREVIEVPLIGMEPMVKPAAELTRSNVIAVCATPTTLKSERYIWLKSQYCKNVAVIEPDCSDWAAMVENNQINHQAITDIIENVLSEKADVIVLGCTHYHWIESLITELVRGRAVVVQPEEPVIRQLNRVLARLD